MKTYIVSATIKSYYHHHPERKVIHPVKAKDQSEAEKTNLKDFTD